MGADALRSILKAVNLGRRRESATGVGSLPHPRSVAFGLVVKSTVEIGVPEKSKHWHFYASTSESEEGSNLLQSPSIPYLLLLLCRQRKKLAFKTFRGDALFPRERD